MESLAAAIIGLVFGVVVAQIALWFFDEEIFDGMDRLRDKVRRLLRLNG